MTHLRQFGRHARGYERFNLIQRRLARALAERIPPGYERIVDLGCGGGGFLQAYERTFTNYLAVDASAEMLGCHPRAEGVECMVGDFNDPSLFETLVKRDFDLLVSSSALQWAADLDWTLGRIAELKRPVALTIFTSGTFATLHEMAGIRSPIRSREETEAALRRRLDVEIDLLRYRLYFKSVRAMLSYIRRSGVSGGRNLLGYRQVKRLVESYPLPYLEFEALRALSADLVRSIKEN